MMSGCGLLDGSQTLCYPHLVMETEVYGIVQRLADGIVVDDETLALDVIRKVGPERHLPRREAHAPPRRQIWRPAVWDRTPYDAWLAAGKRGALEKATEIAAEILASHRARAAARRRRAELAAAIVARADDELRS